MVIEYILRQTYQTYIKKMLYIQLRNQKIWFYPLETRFSFNIIHSEVHTTYCTWWALYTYIIIRLSICVHVQYTSSKAPKKTVWSWEKKTHVASPKTEVISNHKYVLNGDYSMKKTSYSKFLRYILFTHRIYCSTNLHALIVLVHLGQIHFWYTIVNAYF